MDLNVGDIVEFKNYEDMSWNETLAIPKNKFPKSGKVAEIIDSNEGVVYFYIEGNPCSFINKSVARVVDADTHFIIQENYYGMYIGGAGKLVSDKSKAKIYTSGNIANSDATDMHLNAWDVIPYDD
ncbi:hypothetical protein [Lactobacillus acetotolerans]|uniref:hypothetical protein n=1 Tax=Lactobacillus acetotolerans TaxID=1600 RepID=UPI002FDACDB5